MNVKEHGLTFECNLSDYLDTGLFLDHRPWLSDFEINPLIVLAQGDGVRAVDVRVVRRKP